MTQPQSPRVTVITGFLLLLVAMAARADRLEVPLLIETHAVAHAVAAVLDLDEAGRGRIDADPCNRVELGDLVVATADQELVLSFALRAITGAHVMGQCRGPSPWDGRMNVALVPGVEPDGLAVRFTPLGVELTRSDGSPGLLTGPTRLLAENLVLPRIERLRLDLAEPLAAIDGLLEASRPGRAPAPLEGTRIHAVDVLDTGLSLRLGVGIGAVAGIDDPPAEPPLSPQEQLQWQQREDELDGFLTTIITALAARAGPELRLELMAVLLDARHALAEALGEQAHDQAPDDADVGDPDPVRRIFIASWDQLRPWLAELGGADAAGVDADLRLAAFLAGGDALRALDALGPAVGLEISADGLRRLARLLLAEQAPERFTPLPLEVDPALRTLFGLDRQPPVQSRWRLPPLLDWLLPRAWAAAETPAEALRGLVPRLAILDDYLKLVASLLKQQTTEHLSAGSRVPAHLKPRFDPLVWATAWKESCWRQFIGSTENPRVLTSPVGALGMMQINGRVWRGTYDQKRLAEEVDYNVTAGAEILEHYLVDYAIRREEHKHPGGEDNLVRATYAAYNGGPSHMGRYRRDNTPARLRAIDNDFWRHYQTMKSSQWPEVSTCYAVGE
jgi:hypothetical protein